MSDAQQPPGSRPGEPGGSGGQGGHGEPVGSVGEEAAKLFGALSAWAREQAHEQAAEQASKQAREQTQGASEPGVGPAAAAREALARGLHDVGEHLGTAGPDCRWCPMCQVIHVVRQTSPEVRAHLASAAGSLMQAAAGLMATTPPPSGRGPVEHIDLDDGTDPWDDHQQEEHDR